MTHLLMAGPAERAGPAADYGEVFRLHGDRMARLAFLLCGDRQRAEDVVAEAFARVYPHWRRGGVEDLAAYLRRAVVNEARRGGRRLVLERRHAERRVRPPEQGSPEGPAADRDLVLAALRRLPARQRAVLVLRYYEDLSEADIAAALGVAAGTVKSNLSRGLAALRAHLQEVER